MNITIGPTDRVLFVGMTGSGKTYREWECLSGVSRFAILDPKHSAAFERPGFPINRAYNAEDEKQIIRVPITGDEEREWDKAIRAAWAQGNITLVVDEVTLINEQRRIRPALGMAIRTGRERGVRVFNATQRPRDIPRAVLTECEHMMIGLLTDEDDRKRMRGFIGVPAYEALPREKHPAGGGDFLYFHVPSQTFQIIPRGVSLGPGPTPPKRETVHEKMSPLGRNRAAR